MAEIKVLNIPHRGEDEDAARMRASIVSKRIIHAGTRRWLWTLNRPLSPYELSLLSGSRFKFEIVM
jgi:hypothetical protein